MLGAPNFYERLLSVVSKRAALRHYRERMAFGDSISDLRFQQRAYEATERSRLRRRKIDQRSANQINQVSIESLRFQARNLEENHDLAKSILNTLVAFIVGRGIGTIPMVKDAKGDLLPEVNQTIQKLWQRWGRRPEVTGQFSWGRMQRLLARSWLRDGEVFARILRGRVKGMRHNNQLQYSLQMLEADYCPVGYTKEALSVRQGVKLSEWGRPLEYKLHKKYPTEAGFGVGMLTSTPMGSMIFVDEASLITVPADQIIQLNLSDRIGAVRGASIFASVFSRLMDLKDYEESERVAARIGAALTLAMTRDANSGADPFEKSSEPSWVELEIVPGMVAHDLLPGEKVEVIKNERPSNQMDVFRRSSLRAVAGGTRAGYSSVSKEYEGSYSSQRQELQEQNGIYGMMRDEFVSTCVEPIYRNFILMARVQGLLPGTDGFDLDDLVEAKHVGSGVPYIEPKKEIEADAVAIQNRIKSRSQVILERTGRNPDDVAREIAQEKAFDADLGLLPVPGLEPEPEVNEGGQGGASGE